MDHRFPTTNKIIQISEKKEKEKEKENKIKFLHPSAAAWKIHF
jgi:hypothetical protein